MRVLYLTDSLSDLDGVGQYALRLISALEELEPALRVEILLARKHRPTSAAVPARWKVRVALPPDYFLYMRGWRFWASYLLSTWRSCRAARRADLVHAIKDFPHNWVAVSAARLAGRPCVATAHGTYTVQPLLSPRHARRARRTYRRFDAMISVSGYTRRRLLEVLGPGEVDADRLVVLPNCVDAAYYETPRDVGDRPWHDVRFTLSMGETKERKGHHLALEAWARVAARHPELHHFVVGKLSGDEYERRLRGIVERGGVADRVHFLGNVTEDEKVDLLQRAEVFVHTPVTAEDGGFEGFGIVYLEASAASTPCLGTRGCGAEDAIVDGETGLLVAPEAAAVEAGLARILGDAELRSRMGRRGREHAGRNTWRPNAERVLRIYREALAR